MLVVRFFSISLLLGLVLWSAPSVQAQSYMSLLQEANAAQEAEHYERAGNLYERAYAVSGGEVMLLYLAARTFAQAGQHDKAFHNLEQVIAAGWPHVQQMKQDSTLILLYKDDRWSALITEAEAHYAAFDLPLRQELLRMAKQDQQNRAAIGALVAQYGRYSPQADSAFDAMEAQDEPLQARIKEIITEHG